MRSFIKFAFRSIGIEVLRAQRTPGPGGAARSIGNISSFLEDLRARAFVPGGIIDVGANRGDWTRLALSIFPATPVIMIEPLDEMETRRSRIAIEIPDCHYVKAGAGREEEELVMTIVDELAVSSFLPETSSENAKRGKRRKTKIGGASG